MRSIRNTLILVTGLSLAASHLWAQSTLTNQDFQNFVLQDVDGTSGTDNLLQVGTRGNGEAFFTGSKTNTFDSGAWREWSSQGTSVSSDEVLMRDSSGNQYVSVGSFNASDVYATFSVQSSGPYWVNFRMAGDGFVTLFDGGGRIALLDEVRDTGGNGQMVTRSDQSPSHSFVVNSSSGAWNSYSFLVNLSEGQDYRLYFTNYWSNRSELYAAAASGGGDSAAFTIDDVSVDKVPLLASRPDLTGGP